MLLDAIFGLSILAGILAIWFVSVALFVSWLDRHDERARERRLKMELSTSNGTLEPAWDEEDEKNWTVDDGGEDG
jgi:hypothetical protein